jgi:hypothetical protein
MRRMIIIKIKIRNQKNKIKFYHSEKKNNKYKANILIKIAKITSKNLNVNRVVPQYKVILKYKNKNHK